MRSRGPLVVVTVVLIALASATAGYLAGGAGTQPFVLATVTPYPTTAIAREPDVPVAAIQVTMVVTATPEIPWCDTGTAYNTHCIVPLWVPFATDPPAVPTPPLCTPGFVGLDPDTWCRWRALSLLPLNPWW
jgi:hypothetical protein